MAQGPIFRIITVNYHSFNFPTCPSIQFYSCRRQVALVKNSFLVGMEPFRCPKHLSGNAQTRSYDKGHPPSSTVNPDLKSDGPINPKEVADLQWMGLIGGDIAKRSGNSYRSFREDPLLVLRLLSFDAAANFTWKEKEKKVITVWTFNLEATL